MSAWTLNQWHPFADATVNLDEQADGAVLRMLDGGHEVMALDLNFAMVEWLRGRAVRRQATTVDQGAPRQ